MPTPKSTGLTSDNPELLSKVIAAARTENDKIMKNYEGREDEIDELEKEIINEYTNNDDIKLATSPDHIQIQTVLGCSQRHLSRVTEIHSGALRNITKLKATQSMLANALLPLMQGGSADIRNAKTNDCTQGINYLIALEEGLINICEKSKNSTRKCVSSAKSFRIGFGTF
jgi:hypothetical protein